MSEKNEYRLKMPERETYIRFSMSDNICELNTLEPKWIRHMDKLCAKHPEEFKCVKRDARCNYAVYEFSKKFVTVRAPRKTKPLTEERKLKLRQAANEYWERKRAAAQANN